MNWTNTAHGYGLLQILFHWISAAAIALLIPLGLWMTSLDYYDPWYTKAPDLHRGLGMLFGGILLLQLFFHIVQTRPIALTRGRTEALLARLAHWLLYALQLIVVISGYLISTADGRAIDVFGWFSIPATLYGLSGLEDVAGDVHFIVSMMLIVIVALHIAAALRHHIVLGDATLRRMLRPVQ